MYDVCFSYFSYTYIHFIRANCYKLKVLDIPMVTISLNRPLNNELHCTVLHYREPPGAGNRGVLLGLGLYCVAFLAVYLVVPNPLVFQVAARCAVLYTAVLQTMYGIVVVVMILQACRTLQLQYSHQVIQRFTVIYLPRGQINGYVFAAVLSALSEEASHT